jgi:hypothetical protein
MPKCIAFIWGTNKRCQNPADFLPGSDGENKYCGDHYANLVYWSQNAPGDSVVEVQNQNGVKEKVCLDPVQNKAIWCKDVYTGYAGSPRSPVRTPISLMGSPGSPRRGLMGSPRLAMVRPGSPKLDTIQAYLQKPSSPRVGVPGSPRTILRGLHPGGAGLVPAAAAPGEPANIQLQPGETGKKKKCDETMTGHECEEDDEEKFVDGREPRGSRLIRAAPDIKLECNPPYINFLNNEGIVNAMEILDRTKDAKEGLEQIAIIKNTIKFDPKNKGYNYNVTEGVVDKVAAKFARYMFDADRIELLLTFMFYYDSRDLSQKLSFYGFKTGSAKRINQADVFFPEKKLIEILNAAESECYYPTRPQEIPPIRKNMYQNMGTATSRGGGAGEDGIDYCQKFNDELKADYQGLTNPDVGLRDRYNNFSKHCDGTKPFTDDKEVKKKFGELKEAIATAKRAGQSRQPQQQGGGGSNLTTPSATGGGAGSATALRQGQVIKASDYLQKINDALKSQPELNSNTRFMNLKNKLNDWINKNDNKDKIFTNPQNNFQGLPDDFNDENKIINYLFGNTRGGGGSGGRGGRGKRS